jgi:hypothetical protein
VTISLKIEIVKILKLEFEFSSNKIMKKELKVEEATPAAGKDTPKKY